MVKVIRLNDGGVGYHHRLTHPNENEREYIFGGDGDDVIIGDNETEADYEPNWSGEEGYHFDDLASYGEVSSSLWLSAPRRLFTSAVSSPTR